jgi:chorismate mutase
MFDSKKFRIILFLRSRLVGWRFQAIRGATTVELNTKEAITAAVTEMIDALEAQNKLNLDDIVSVTFSVTKDLDAIFPAAIARARKGWESVPFIDVQQMHVVGSLPQCIRFMILVQTEQPSTHLNHIYLRGAKLLRPDLVLR